MLTAFGAAAVTFMMLMYALERRGRGFVFAFGCGCLLSSAYGFLAGTVAVRRGGADLGRDRVQPAQYPRLTRRHNAPVEIVRAGAERIPDLQPLWESLSHHHAEVAPELSMLGEPRSDADSWAVRRALYEEWLAEPDAFVLIAEIDERPVGYALVSMRGPEETWATGDRVAELQTLAVLPGHRGAGIGGALVDRMYEELRRLGVGHFVVGVVASNADAVRFYERLRLTKFIVAYAGQVPPA